LDENEALGTKKREVFFPFIITQIICVVLIIITLLVTRFFFKDTFAKAKTWYKENFLIDTDIKSVIESGAEENEI